MATVTATFIPSTEVFAGAASRVGTLATTASANVTLGAKRIYRLSFIVQPASSVNFALRFQLYNSATSVPAAPGATSNFFQNNQENIFETGESYDSIAITNLAADNGAVTLAYSFTPLSKF